MITINELNGARIRKSINALRVIKSYENKHKDRSGNFGFIIRVKNPKVANTYLNGESWFDINGDYNTKGEIYRLTFGNYSSAGSRLEFNTLDDLYRIIRDRIKAEIS